MHRMILFGVNMNKLHRKICQVLERHALHFSKKKKKNCNLWRADSEWSLILALALPVVRFPNDE